MYIVHVTLYDSYMRTETGVHVNGHLCRQSECLHSKEHIIRERVYLIHTACEIHRVLVETLFSHT